MIHAALHRGRRWGPLLGVLLGACIGDGHLGPRRAPSVSALTAAPNSLNALSLVADFYVEDADSARLVYAAGSEPEAATPFTPVATGPVRLVALGLRPSTDYRVAVEAIGSTRTTRSSAASVQTGPLPSVVRDLRLRVTGAPTAGYTLVVPLFDRDTINAVIAIFDAAGALRWYRAFRGEGWAIEAKQHPNGHITAYIGRSYGWQPDAGRFVELAPSGEEVRSFRAAAPSYTDPHELQLTFHDSALAAVHVIGYDLRRVDLTAIGGAADALLAIHTIVRQRPDGTEEFRWSAADHFTIADWPRATPTLPDLVHPSAFALDHDGNYVVSFQAMDEITKIDARTGAVLWRLGGRHSDFTIHDDPLNGFQGQHSVRVLDDGHLLFLDNRVRSTPVESRAVEYRLDESTHSASLVWEYRPAPAIASPIMGSVQRLSNGHTVVAFAVGPIAEVDQAGTVVSSATLTADAAGTPVRLYRAIRIQSLYRYGIP